MANATERAEKTEAQERQYRARQAAIVAGLQATLEPDEQLLAFARGKISGGWRGKFAIGLEAFFAPDVNIGLTERRFLLQHIHATTGTPSDILPHKFPLAEIASITFGDIETFGGEPAGRLVLRLQDEQHFRIKLSGTGTCADAAALVEVFRSLNSSQRKSGLSPTQSLCPHCGHILDRPSKFCPYCGKTTIPDTPAADFYTDIVPTKETTAPDADDSYSEAAPFSAFLAPDFSEPELLTPPAAALTEEPAPVAATDEATGGFALQDEAGEDLFPEIPIGFTPQESELETPAAPLAPEISMTTAFREGGSPTIELDIRDLEGITETDAPANAAAVQNPKPAVQNLQNPAEPSPASTAFWREFARISGVATPEVFAAQIKTETPTPELPRDELAPVETKAEKPAFPLAEEEN